MGRRGTWGLRTAAPIVNTDKKHTYSTVSYTIILHIDVYGEICAEYRPDYGPHIVGLVLPV